ncbi:MAG: peptidoglycan DD-metalloendopeptidase family protein [Deltaproteobacteria bacterium]|nr:peptidoglycan DD-metalloendopeptidase family protein [Deltaproteobacteria bacterium]
MGRLALVCVLAFLAACSGSRGPAAPELRSGAGFYHELARGETIWQIAQRYAIPVEAILRANRIEDPSRLATGARIFVPGVRPLPGDEAPPLVEETPLVRGCDLSGEMRRERQELARREADVAFEWPVRGRITTCFAPENGRPHDGIDIAVPEGTPVRAAESGKVVYSATLGAYGNLIVVRHGGAYTSLYAHNEKNFALPGDVVEKGDVIAEAGESGNASGPHVHFEIRRQRRPDNPILYLP